MTASFWALTVSNGSWSMEFHWLEISPMVFSTSDDAVTDDVLFKVLTNVFPYRKNPNNSWNNPNNGYSGSLLSHFLSFFGCNRSGTDCFSCGMDKLTFKGAAICHICHCLLNSFLCNNTILLNHLCFDFCDVASGDTSSDYFGLFVRFNGGFGFDYFCFFWFNCLKYHITIRYGSYGMDHTIWSTI